MKQLKVEKRKIPIVSQNTYVLYIFPAFFCKAGVFCRSNGYWFFFSCNLMAFIIFSILLSYFQKYVKVRKQAEDDYMSSQWQPGVFPSPFLLKTWSVDQHHQHHQRTYLRCPIQTHWFRICILTRCNSHAH